MTEAEWWDRQPEWRKWAIAAMLATIPFSLLLATPLVLGWRWWRGRRR